MRVLVVTPWLPSKSSPVYAPFIANDVTLLQDSHEVIVLHLGADVSHETEEKWGRNRVVRVPFDHTKPHTWLHAVQTVRRYLRGADLIHSMALPALLPVCLSGVRIPWVHTEHYGMLLAQDLTSRQERAVAMLKKLLRFPTEVVVVSQALAGVVDRLRERPAAIIENHVAVVSNETRGDTLALSPEGAISMVAVGNLIDSKGPLVAVDALAALRAKGYSAHLTWVGSGPLQAEVERYATARGVDSHLSMPGPIAPDRLGKELLKHNVFVLPTKHETFGVALAEALGHGLPVVASGSGGHLSFLPPQGSRWVQDRTGEAIANAIISLASDPHRMTSQQLIDYASARFSNFAREEAYRAVYKAALR